MGRQRQHLDLDCTRSQPFRGFCANTWLWGLPHAEACEFVETDVAKKKKLDDLATGLLTEHFCNFSCSEEQGFGNL